MVQPKKRGSLALLPSLVEEAEDNSFHNEVSTRWSLMKLSLTREIKVGNESEQLSHEQGLLHYTVIFGNKQHNQNCLSS